MNSEKSLAALYAELGAKLLEVGRYEEAVDALTKALAEPETKLPRATTYLALGKTYSALGKDSEALKAFADAVREDADVFPQVEKELSKLQELKQQKSSSGKGWLWGILSGFSPRPEQFLSNIASNLYNNQKFSEAETLFRYIAGLSPKDANAQEYLGWTRLKQGKVVESIEAFRSAEAIDNQRVSVYQGLGNAYLSLGYYDKATEALDQALKLKPDQTDILSLSGVALRQTGKLDASETAFRRIIELQPENYSALRELALTLRVEGKNTEAAAESIKAAQLLLRNKQYNEAAQLSKDAIDLDSSNGLAYLQLGQARIGQKQYDDALLALDDAAKSLPREPQVHILAAEANFLNGDLEKALERTDEGLRLEPDSPQALGIKGAIKQRLQENDEALQLLDKSLALDEKQFRFHTERGHVLENLEEPAEAIDAYKRSIELQPACRWTQARLGMLLMDEGIYEDAAIALHQALELPPGEDEVFYSVKQPLEIYTEGQLRTTRGDALRAQNEADQALHEFERALELDPGNALACKGRGAALIDLGRYQEAVSALQLALDLYAAEGMEDNSEVYANLGEALRALGKYSEAKNAFDQALKVDPEYQWVLARLGETLRVLDSDKPEIALPYLEKAVALEPEDAWALGALGATQHSLSRYRSALGTLEKAIQLEPNDAFNHGYKGKVLRDVNRLEPAVQCLDRALELDANIDWVLMEKALALREMPDHADKEAITYIRRAVELRPDSGYNVCQLGVSQYYLGDYSEALAQVDKSISLDSSLDWANCLKSLILEKTNRTAEAQEAEDRFLTVFTGGAEAFFQRGMTYNSLLAYEHAIRDLNKAIELQQDHRSAYNLLAWIYTVSPKSDLDQALKLAQRAVESSSDDENYGSYLDTLGWIYYKQDKYKDALPILEKAAALNPEQLEIEDHLQACRQRIDEEQSQVTVSGVQ